jgi:hypothetical protein
MSWCIKEWKRERPPRPTQAVSTTTEEELPSPQTTPPANSTPVTGEEDEESIGDLSAAMSIYTTDDSVARGYNAKRLDKVIAIARHQSDEMQERFAI